MPPKVLIRTRTWGTRFDSLLSHQKSVNPSSINHDSLSALQQQNPDAVYAKTERKMPHDASIFVGSLPANIDQTELALLLSEHLSQHAEVKSVKVVRDSKGGVCAFVQCENAFSAANLINTIHSSPPRPFLGRYLRYEPARAFRTLLISYRIPTRFIPPGPPEVDSLGHIIHREGKTVELDLPAAMRLWKPQNSKFFHVLYNVEAHDSNMQNKNADSPPYEVGLFLHPLSFDVETIHKLSAFFGPIEYVRPYSGRGEQTSSTEQKCFPYPHLAPRSPAMDSGCWEIKWNHRDDCVAALMALRRVPHLTVTWAHQPHSQGYDAHPYNTRWQPNILGIYPQGRRLISRPEFHSPPTHDISVVDRSPDSSSGSPTMSSVPKDVLSDALDAHGPPPSPEQLVPLQRAVTGDAPKPADVSGGCLTSSPKSECELPPTQDETVDIEDVTKVQWSEMDFPPLAKAKGDGGVESGSHHDKEASKETEEEPLVETPRSISSKLTIQPDDTFDASKSQHGEGDEGLDPEMPPTPEFGGSPNTSRNTSGQFPETPPTYAGDLQGASHNIDGFEVKDRLRHSADASNFAEKDLDPTTIFVGGLEMFGPNAWDEKRVHSHFARFGGVENVKVVRPANSRSAFAFVKFDNIEAPARAVSNEHNRIFDGRPIRVQIRDCNPQSRGAWKYHGRNRGRYYPQRTSEGVDRNMDARENIPPNEPLQHTQFLLRNDGSRSPLKEVSMNLVNAVAPVDASVKYESDSSHTSPEAPSAKETSPERQHWYEQEPISAPRTSPESSLGSSASAHAYAYTVPAPMGYCPPTWVPPYVQPYPYPMPFLSSYGYHYPPPAPSQAAATPPCSDSGAPHPAVYPWPPMGGMYQPFVPYAPYQASQPQGPPSQVPQAPLLPTGFMHGEQGTLIPVYPPDKLDQYMSAHGAAPPNSHAPQTTAYPQPTWAYPQMPTVGYPSSAPPQAGAPIQLQQIPSSQSLNMGWNHGVGMPAIHQQLTQVVYNGSAPARLHAGGYGAGGPAYPSAFQQGQRRITPPPPRRHHRRDHEHNNSGYTNRQFVRGGNRYPRNMAQGGESNNPDSAAGQQVVQPSEP